MDARHSLPEDRPGWLMSASEDRGESCIVGQLTAPSAMSDRSPMVLTRIAESKRSNAAARRIALRVSVIAPVGPILGP